MNGKIAALLLAAALPVLAHHSFAAEYDSSKLGSIQGKVVSVDWVNPHAWLQIAVSNPGAGVVEWRCEMPPPNRLSRSGWSKGMLKPGDEITVSGFLGKDGVHTLWLLSLVLPDGSRLVIRRSAP
jgi:hypothetical protein